MFKSIILFVILIFITGCKNNTKELIILETTDVHGTLFPYDFLRDKPSDHGYLAAAYIIDSIRNVYGKDNVLYVDCGDLLQGSPLVDYYNFTDTITPHPMITILNDLQLDAFIVGNHDIEQGKEVWKRAGKLSKFPWLAANAVYTKFKDSTVFKPYLIIRKGGLKVGILGQITPAIPNWLPKEIYSGIEFLDMNTSVKKWLPKVKSQADISIGAFHSGVTPQKSKPGYPEEVPEENASAQIAENFPGFSVILSGHQHKVIPEKESYIPDNTPAILMSGKKAEYVGFVKITYKKENDKIIILDKKTKNFKVNGRKAPKHLLKKYDNVKQQITQLVNTPIGEIKNKLAAAESRLKDTPIIDLIHKIQLDKTEADISLAASFKTQLEIPVGPVSRKSVFLIYPYENTLYKIKMQGKDIIDHLTRGANYYQVKNGKLEINKDVPGYNFDMAEGIEYKIIYSFNKKNKIEAVKLTNGQIFNPNKYYTVAVNSYRAQQLMKLYKCELLWKSQLSMRDFVEEYFKNNSPVSVEANNNWEIIVED
ncbi:MAG: bifunctional metallophosphatase/5'-nucleotidase [Calditrichia bacterium]|nr:bifunctional metallophosphatase/5'-nucleotidase [Calditrichia bacterium]